MRILLILLLLSASSATFAQEAAKAVDLDPAVMEKIVRIVLTNRFKPANEPTYIDLSDRFIQEYWLPNVDKTTFILLNDEEYRKRGKAYFFNQPVMDKDEIRVDFGFGDGCSATGPSFWFKVTGTDVSQVPRAGGWGSAC